MSERQRPSPFAAHGDTQARFDDGLPQVVATGPFNLEGVQRLAETMVAGYRDLAPGTPVVNVCEMRGTLVYTVDAWSALDEAIRRTGDSGLRVLATAWIVDEALEGARLLLPRARALFAARGRRFEVFAQRAAAETWARARLAEAGAPE